MHANVFYDESRCRCCCCVTNEIAINGALHIGKLSNKSPISRQRSPCWAKSDAVRAYLFVCLCIARVCVCVFMEYALKA